MWSRYFANDTLHATWFTNRHRVRQAQFTADCLAKATEWQAGMRSIRIMRNMTKPQIAYQTDAETNTIGITGGQGRYTPTNTALLGNTPNRTYDSTVVSLLTASATASMPAHLYGTLPAQWGSMDAATGRVTFSNVMLM
jgi:hypothetical protein